VPKLFEAMQKGFSRANTGKELADGANITFKDIFDVLSLTLGQIQAVAKSAKKMAQNNQVVTGSITAIAAISEQNMASTQEVSAII